MQSGTPTSKTDVLFFLTNKRLSAGTIYVRFLIYPKAIGSCLLWVMSTEISVDIAVDIAVDSRSIVGR